MRFFRFALTCCPHNKSKKIFNTFPCLKAVSYSPNYSSVLYHFLDKTIYLSKIPVSLRQLNFLLTNKLL